MAPNFAHELTENVINSKRQETHGRYLITFSFGQNCVKRSYQ
jgi:hypothetical protein